MDKVVKNYPTIGFNAVLKRKTPTERLEELVSKREQEQICAIGSMVFCDDLYGYEDRKNIKKITRK